MDALSALIRERPLTCVLLSNGVVLAVSLFVATEGKPLKWLSKQLFRAVLASIPASIVDAETAKLQRTIEAEVVGHVMKGEAVFTSLPEVGLSETEVVAYLDRYAGKDAPRWRQGKVSGAVYHGGDDLTHVMTEAFARFALSNPLHPDTFPSLRKMEADVVAMTLSLFSAPPQGCGTMTSGGSESILMAMKAYRDHARATRGVTEPELVIPETAHAAFNKAAAYFGIALKSVPVDPVTFRADARAMIAAITPYTIALVGSAPCYPQGVIDPISELAAAALARGIPMHVDCCLGSFLIAFAARAGRPVRTPYDFAVPGVTSISVDTHKYGFAPKGSSVIMYANPVLRRAQYFVAPEWTGGIYASPSVAGSRCGAVIAAAWATLMRVGAAGYIDASKTILSAAVRITQGVRDISARGIGIELYGEPDLSVVCFGPARSAATGSSAQLNIYNVGDAMSNRGWTLNTLQNPACIHFCVTYANAGRAEEFLRDLEEAVEEVRTAPPGKFKDGNGALYGMAASIPDKSVVVTVAHNFLDALYVVDKPGGHA